jgi:glycosyltransferase involved in cell wall biosynthesis
LPVALMEATSVGLPIVATAVGGVPQVLTDGKSALVVPPNQPVALADAMARVASDAALRERLGREARVRSDMFDITQASKTVGEVHLSVRPNR